MLPLSALLLLGGTLGDRFGRRRIFACGILLFAAASVACGLAYDAASLIIARAVQGLGAALMIPGSLSMLSAVFSGRARGAAIGTWSAMTAVTTAIGPPVGGWLVDFAGWRWIFFINIPFAIAALWILYVHAPESRAEGRDNRLDWPGAAAISIALAALVYGLITAGIEGLSSPLTWAALSAGIVLLALFVVLERHAPNPMVPLRVFGDRRFAGITLVTLLLYAGLSGGMFFLPFNLIQLQGYAVLEAAAALLPFVVLIATLSRFSGRLAASIGGRPVIGCGALAVAGALFWLGEIPPEAGYWRDIGPPLALLGLGMGFCVAPISTVAMSALPDYQTGLASGINNAVARVATLLAIAGLGLTLTVTFGFGLDLAPGPWSADAVRVIEAARRSLLDVSIPETISQDEVARLSATLRTAYQDGFAALMRGAALLSLAAALTAVLTLKQEPDATATGSAD